MSKLRLLKPQNERLPLIVDALEYCRRYLQRPRLEVQQIQMLMTLRRYPDGVHMQELAKVLKADPSFVSRNTKAFGPDSKGRRVLAQRIDDANPRYRLVYLTPDGQQLVDTTLKISSGEIKPPKIAPIKDSRCKD